MKSIKIITGILLILLFNQTFAQEKGTEEFKIGYGLGTSTQIMYDIADIFITVFTLSGITYEDEKSLGALYINYNYSVSDVISFGGLVAYEQIKNDVYSNNLPIGKNTCGFYTIALETEFHYVRNKKFQMYSGLGLAYTYGTLDFDSSTPQEKSSNYNLSLFNFNFTGVGFRFGSTFGGFVEFGFGYKGIVNAGLSYQL